MDPHVQDALTQFATIAGPAIAAFLAGHFHVIFKNPNPPATPGTSPALPSANPNPGTVRPIGQGGILDMLGIAANQVAPSPGQAIAPVGQGGILQMVALLVQGIITSPGTTKAKADAVSAVVTAAEPFAGTDTTPVVGK